MATESSVQTAVWQMEFGGGKKAVRWALVVLLALALGLVYTASQFRGLNKREAMDMAQLAHNLARGRGFTTYVIRPLSLWQLKTQTDDHDPRLMEHPDLYNPPLYPLVLAGLFRLLPPKVFEYSAADRIYEPERWVILPFNQMCLLLTLLLVYRWATQLFDRRVAVMAGLLMLFSDTLWSYSISGLPTNLLMLLFLLALYCLFLADRRLNPPHVPEAELGSEGQPAPPSLSGATIGLVLASAVLMGLCFLTTYRAAFLIVPMALYAVRVLRGRSAVLWGAVYGVVFLAVIAPWLARNYNISHSLLGVAKYEYLQDTGAFRGDVLSRSYHPEMQGAFSLKSSTSKFLANTRGQLIDGTKQIGTDFLIFFFGVGLLYTFRRRDRTVLRYTILGIFAFAIIATAVVGGSQETSNPRIWGGNLLLLLLPLVAIYGVAFFYLLLDQIPFRIRLTRAAAVGAFALLNVAPMIFALLPPRLGAFPYPPYFPPITQFVAGLFGEQEVGTSDLPWAMAWNGDRRTVWLPMTPDEFSDLHDFVAPKGISFLLFTPYMLDRPMQSGILKGEYKSWSTITRGQLGPNFPLKAATLLPPDNDLILLADRERWKNRQLQTPSPGEEDKQPQESKTNAPPPSATKGVARPGKQD